MSDIRPIVVQFLRLAEGEGLPLPAYETEGAAGFDLRAAVPADVPVEMAPGSRARVPIGFAVAVPGGYELQVRPRSGLAVRHGVTVLNAPGTVDADYRGPVAVLLVNHGSDVFRIERGDRIAQGVVAPVMRAATVEVWDLDATERGTGGFGSTGRR